MASFLEPFPWACESLDHSWPGMPWVGRALAAWLPVSYLNPILEHLSPPTPTALGALLSSPFLCRV